MNADVVYPKEMLSKLYHSSFENVLAVDIKSCGREEVKVIDGGQHKISAIGKDLIEDQCLGEFIGVAKFSSEFMNEFVNALGQLCGIAALDDLDYLDSRIDEMNDAKKFFVDNLPHEYYAVDSQTNFVLLKTPDSKKLLNKMKKACQFLARDRKFYLCELQA